MPGHRKPPDVRTDIIPTIAGISILSPTFEKSLTCNDKYVVLYDFGNNEAAGLHTEVRPGFEKTILVLVKASRNLLGNRVYKSRVRDWLYGITQTRPEGNKDTVVSAAFEAEDLLSMYHLVYWPQDMGGAGITPELGKWQNVKSIFPLHNERVNQTLLVHLSSRLWITVEDLDQIRDLFGAKVAFYFAFIQTYLVFLAFPAITGIMAWLWLPRYSLAYAILTVVWCTIFLEYWRVREIDLSIRWQVRGVHNAEINRPEFRYEKIITDRYGRTVHYFPRWKSIVRQLLQIPFILVAAVALGIAICSVFFIEILISELYVGPYRTYLEYLPTVLLAVGLPYVSAMLESVARWLTTFENHRTEDNHEMSLTQKIFVLNIITNYLPILLTAFVYVPFGNQLFPMLQLTVQHVTPDMGITMTAQSFRMDADRLRNEVIALTVTGQVQGFFEENILPLIRHKASAWWRQFRHYWSRDTVLLSVVADDEGEAEFLASCRNQGTLDTYNVQDDYAELVLQFGYLALFSPVWPLIPLGFLINNWVELRSDFAKICIEFQRPAPCRADGIGPWITSLQILVWLGSITSAAIVHLFGADGITGRGSWQTLPITIFISEHILLLIAGLARFGLTRLGSEQIRKERHRRYARRLSILEEIEAHKRLGLGLNIEERERRKSVLLTSNDVFWTKQVEDGSSVAEAMRLMTLVKGWEGSNGKAKKEQ
ncbi:Uncharacterized protein ESCO_006847 [Escovopsis weberi]|uniref:Uncharacterized protein n=1 Tax=Escovopsis weberi TaxID=150374 RepID=A0A0M8N640_ESCWE|nr:Uncharacterized protein ESCO_006847 [Escovopsis weberi]